MSPIVAPSSGPGPAPAAPRVRRRPPAEDMTAVWEAYKATGDTGLRNQLVEAYHYIVQGIGNRVAARLPRSIDVQDLRSAGVFGLLRAIENYDLERGTPFESYCVTRVRGAILDELRRQDWVPRLVRRRATTYAKAVVQLRNRYGRDPAAHEMAAYLDIDVEEAEKLRREANLTTVFNLAPPEDNDDEPRVLWRLDALMDRGSELPFDRLVAKDLARALVKKLLPPERTVVALYYHEGLTMREIGDVMGISESRVCQIHAKLLKKLKEIIDDIGESAPRRKKRPSFRPAPR